MSVPVSGQHQQWASRIGFLLAAIGAAVGLGSVWKFPYVVGANGGGAFVLVYLVASLVVTLPILIAELMLGRRGQASPPNAMLKVAREIGASPAWRWLGWLTVATIYVILSYYSVIGGWVIAYMVKAAGGAFSGASTTDIATLFAALKADMLSVILYHALFMILTVGIILRGVQQGIERAAKIMMPALFLMLMVLIGYAAVYGDFRAALSFLFKPDMAAINGTTILSAVGLSFFTIGTGMAIMMTYGSYLPKDSSVVRAAAVITTTVPIAALATGLAVFPVVFANGLNPSEGPGLLFVTLPVAFGHMPGGVFFGALFFLLVLFAALTSSIAAIEPVVAWAAENKGISRVKSAIGAGLLAWTFGLLSVLSFGDWADFHPLAGLAGGMSKYGQMTIFDLLDFLASNIMLPLGNILICLFVGWCMPGAFVKAESGVESPLWFSLWRFTLRYIAPLLIAVILIMGL